MNPLQRLMAVLDNSSQEKLCMPLVFGYSARIGEVKLKTYLRSGECIAQCQIKAQEKFGYDAVFVFADNCVEAEAIGSQVHFPENAYPYITRPFLEEFGKLKNVSIPDPYQDGRMPEILKAVHYLRSYGGEGLPVVGVLLGPMSIAGQLLGLERLLFLLIDTPHEFEKVIKYTSEICLEFGLALIKAGVHIPVLQDPSASQSVIPKDVFVKYLFPSIHTIFAQFKSVGALATWLMITGNTRDILPYYSQCGTNIANIDYEVNFKEALSLAPELVIAGNIKPYSFVKNTPQEIATQAKELMNLAVGNKRFIVGSGCEVPLDTKPENLLALVRAARE